MKAIIAPEADRDKVMLREPSRPRGGGASTSQGRPYSIFRRALQHGNLLVAEATAKELPPLSLTDALELTILIAQGSASASAGRGPLVAALPRGAL
jgi:hypothetical protein